MTSKRAFLLGLGGAVASVAGLIFWLVRPSEAQGVALTARERAMERLGERIAELRPGAKVLVLANPFSREAGYGDEKRRFERVAIAGLRKGLGRGGAVDVEVVFPGLRPEYIADPASVVLPPDSRTPLSFVVRPESVDELASAHADRGVIVSLIGLPAGVEKLGVWRAEDARSFALLLPDLRVVGSAEEALAAFERGKVLVAVGEERAEGEPLIVTRENAAEVLRQRPRALGY